MVKKESKQKVQKKKSVQTNSRKNLRIAKTEEKIAKTCNAFFENTHFSKHLAANAFKKKVSQKTINFNAFKKKNLSLSLS